MTLTIAETIVLNRERQRRLLKARREGKSLDEIAREEEERRLRKKLVNDLAPELAETLSRRIRISQEGPSEDTSLLPPVPTPDAQETEVSRHQNKGETDRCSTGEPSRAEPGRPGPFPPPGRGTGPDYLRNELERLDEKVERLTREVNSLRRIVELLSGGKAAETLLASTERDSIREGERIGDRAREELVQ